MSRRMHFDRRALGAIAIVLIAVGFMSFTPVNISGQATLSLSLDRNVGMALGSIIQGVFTLRGSGPDTIVSLAVFFNGVEVHSVTGNSIAWQFDTAEYASGSTNITLVGWDSMNETSQTTLEVYFLGGIMSTIITVGIVGLVIVLIIVRYLPKLRRE
ncbi:MAG: hypothetical protein JSW61_06960 [Candidatus Thorarchaeota archaeon]|nr:MAG: hypothetical protein JSW61_06960 [Candidatus Thorarchaeota archaeon]